MAGTRNLRDRQKFGAHPVKKEVKYSAPTQKQRRLVASPLFFFSVRHGDRHRGDRATASVDGTVETGVVVSIGLGTEAEIVQEM